MRNTLGQIIIYKILACKELHKIYAILDKPLYHNNIILDTKQVKYNTKIIRK